jgi:hypothetical protein
MSNQEQAQQFIITKNNYIPNSYPPKYTLNLNEGIKISNTSKIALLSATIPNSTPNIHPNFDNNTIVFNWIDGTTNTYTYQNGNYLVQDLANALYEWFYSNNWYMLDSSGNQHYFVALVLNSVGYNVNLFIYPIPTTADLTNSSSQYYGWTKPSGATWSLPSTETTPQILFSSGFGTLIGFSAGQYPTTPQSTSQYYKGIAPQISTITNYTLRCDCVSNNNVLPNDVIAVIPINTTYGREIQFLQSYPIWSNTSNKELKSVSFLIYGQDGTTPCPILDNQITLTFLIKP